MGLLITQNHYDWSDPGRFDRFFIPLWEATNVWSLSESDTSTNMVIFVYLCL